MQSQKTEGTGQAAAIEDTMILNDDDKETDEETDEEYDEAEGMICHNNF